MAAAQYIHLGMNGYQVTILLFALLCIAISIWAVVAVCRDPDLRYKPLWIVGSLFGFMGLGINWTNPADLVLQFGVQIPVVMVYSPVGSGQWLVRAMFPVVAVAALLHLADRSRKRGSQ